MQHVSVGQNMKITEEEVLHLDLPDTNNITRGQKGIIEIHLFMCNFQMQQ